MYNVEDLILKLNLFFEVFKSDLDNDSSNKNLKVNVLSNKKKNRKDK